MGRYPSRARSPRNLCHDDDLVFVTQKSRSATKEKGLHRCNPLI